MMWTITTVLPTLAVAFLAITCTFGQVFKRSDDSLTAVPPDIPADSVEVVLSNNNIQFISDNSFEHLYQVRILNLNSNSLSDFPNLTSVADTLMELYLNHNELATIRQGNLDILTQLVVLEMEDNQITSEDMPSFSNLMKLIRLNIVKNLLAKFPNMTGTSMSALSLKQNDIGHVQPQYMAGMQLTSIDLRVTGLKVFPDLSAIGSTVHTVELSHNDIEVIPSEYLASLTAIKNLYLNKNPSLAYFPNVIAPINDKLKHLWLAQCNFREFPILSNYRRLSIIVIDENPITVIAKSSLRGLSNLHQLYLQSTKLVQVPDLYEVRLSLWYLDISYCEDLTEAPARHLVTAVDLRKLDLTDTPLAQLPALGCSPAFTTFAVSGTGSKLDLCDCDNMWLRQSADGGSTIDVDDVMCGEKMWSQHDVNSLKEVCTSHTGGQITIYLLIAIN